MEKLIMRFGVGVATLMIVAAVTAASMVCCALALWVMDQPLGNEYWRFGLPASALIPLCVVTPWVQAMAQSILSLQQLRNDRERVGGDQRATERREGEGLFSVLVLDLSAMEQGVEPDDALMNYVKTVVQRVIRQVDIGARYGGSGFICLLPNTSANGARVIAERLKQALEGEWQGASELQCHMRTVTMSEDETMDELLVRADRELDTVRASR
ncbi:conserved hypothetical protein [gamma proteobacterium HTCC5015]|nr:conserved hypothetical protein [gamma proteobacterium HTCC5015]